MKMSLITPPSTTFEFDSACTSPYISSPSSPHRFSSKDAASNADQDFEDKDFEFDFSGQFDRVSLSADELFDGGKIKPLKPLPSFLYEYEQSHMPLNSPKSRKESSQENDDRGRERSSLCTKPRHKVTRSLSPFRVSDLLFDPEINPEEAQENSSSSSSYFSSFWYKKWKIKDLLLFRSASESHASENQRIKKCSLLRHAHRNEVKNSSFKSTDSIGSVSRRRSVQSISAHEFHYTVNRANSKEMKKRTFLPYKQGLLGCLGFCPEMYTSCSGTSLSRVGRM